MMDKLAGLHETGEYSHVETFFDWLHTNGYYLYNPANFSETRLLHRYFDIDTKKLEQERRDMLDTFRQTT